MLLLLLMLVGRGTRVQEKDVLDEAQLMVMMIIMKEVEKV